MLIDDTCIKAINGVKSDYYSRICSLIPGVKGSVKNITVISIMNRFLEPPELYLKNGGDQKSHFLSSADWMTRNMG